jgi:hypothetical protein
MEPARRGCGRQVARDVPTHERVHGADGVNVPDTACATQSLSGNADASGARVRVAGQSADVVSLAGTTERLATNQAAPCRQRAGQGAPARSATVDARRTSGSSAQRTVMWLSGAS